MKTPLTTAFFFAQFDFSNESMFNCAHLWQHAHLPTPQEIALTFGTRCYRARGVEANTSTTLKASVMAWLNHDADKVHADTLDFFCARARAAFVVEVALEL